MATGDQSFAYRGLLDETSVDLANIDWSSISGLVAVESGQLVPVTLTTNQLTSSYSAPNLIVSLADPCVMPGSLTVNGGLTFGSTTGLLRRDLGIVSSIADGKSTEYLKGDMTWGSISSTVLPLFSATSPLSYNNTTGVFSLPLGTTSQYLRGDGTWRDFNTDARASISAGSGLTYNSTTGVMTNSATAPSYTLPLSISGSVVSLGYNSTNLKLTASQLDTIQDIATTSTPTFARVNVTSKISTSSSNIGFGGNTLNAVTTGTLLTAIGFDALAANTSGSDNSAMGYRALYSMLNGSQNTAIGKGAMQLATTGNSNTAVGNNAMYSHTSPGQNTAVGSYAMWFGNGGGSCCAFGYSALSVNTGNYNCGFGDSTLGANTSGTMNMGMGWRALFRNTTGSSNVACGVDALANNTTASFNMGVGGQALLSNTTGTRNSAIGYGALRDNTTSSDQTAIGFETLKTTTGARNTAIGSAAGTAITTGTDNVLIGYNAGSTLTTQSNKLYIANTNTTTPLILGDFSSKDVTINDNLTINGLTADRFVITNGSKKLVSSGFAEASGTSIGNVTYGGGSTTVNIYYQAIGSTRFTYSFHLPAEFVFSPSSALAVSISTPHTPTAYLQGSLQCQSGGNDVLGWWYMNAGVNTIYIMPDGDNRTFYFTGVNCKIYPFTVSWII